MLVPIYLGLCRAADLDRGHEAAVALIDANLGMAVMVSVVHSVAMIAAGGFSAWLVYCRRHCRRSIAPAASGSSVERVECRAGELLARDEGATTRRCHGLFFVGA
jgi:hypothetical protein